jgi:hypothetical protein
MNLYDELVGKLEQVNCVQIQRGTDIEAYGWNADHFRWVSHRNGIQTVQQTYQLVQLLCSIPHVSRRKGSMLVVTQINPAIRAD